MRVQGGQLVRATGSCRCAHHSAPASLPPPALAHASLALRFCTRLTFSGVAAQALQEAGYLAQMQDAQASGGLSGMATGLGVAGEMMPPPGMPGDLSGIANLSNPDAGPK